MCQTMDSPGYPIRENNFINLVELAPRITKPLHVTFTNKLYVLSKLWKIPQINLPPKKYNLHCHGFTVFLLF